MLSLLIVGACATLPIDRNAPRACRDEFDVRFARSATFPERQALLRSLNNDDIRCLFEAARADPAPTDAWFVPLARRADHRVQRFFGVNGLVIFREFEKQMQMLADPQGAEQVLGHNVSGIGKFTGSPGWFLLNPGPPAVLDYHPDFVTLLGTPAARAQLEAWQGGDPVEIKNGAGNLLFNELEDTVFALNPDVAVGVAERVSAGRRQVASYFIIVRVAAEPR